MDISVKLFAISCAGLMILLSFQTVSADNGIQIDVFKDSSGNKHKVWREEINGTWQIIYANNIGGNNTGVGHGDVIVVNSTYGIMHPQIAIDPVSKVSYILWIEIRGNGFEFWYCGSNDSISWTEARYGDFLPIANGNPSLDMTMDNYTLHVTWKQGGKLAISPDLDGDFIPDVDDALPLEYNIIPGDSSFIPDAVSFNRQLGLSVAIDYADNNNTFVPIISSSSAPMLNGSIGTYFDITINSSVNFNAIIKLKYNPVDLPAYYTEDLLGIYWFDSGSWKLMSNISLGEKTGVYQNNHYVWAMTKHFSSFTAADMSFPDTDGDGLTDDQEYGGEGTIGPYFRWSDDFNSFSVSQTKWSFNDATPNDGLVDGIDFADGYMRISSVSPQDYYTISEPINIDFNLDYKMRFSIYRERDAGHWFFVFRYGHICFIINYGGEIDSVRENPLGGAEIQQYVAIIPQDEWVTFECYAHSRSLTYDVFMNGQYVGGFDYYGIGGRNTILLGDTLASANYGQMRWDYVEVFQGTDPNNPDSDSDGLNDAKEMYGLSSDEGKYFRWHENFYTLNQWSQAGTGVSIGSGLLHISSTQAGVAYAICESIDLNYGQNYMTKFRFWLPAGNQWYFYVFRFGQQNLILESGGIVRAVSTGETLTTLGTIAQDAWHTIECYSTSASQTYKIVVDDDYFSTANYYYSEGRNTILIGDTSGNAYGEAYWDYIIVAQGTDPLNPDSDGDGLGDYSELYRLANPLNVDSDSDYLSDGEEVYIQGTDPLDPDSDADGINDGIEVNANSAIFSTHTPDPLVKDIYIEVDWMEGYAMYADSIPLLEQVFNSHNIRLHIIQNAQIPLEEELTWERFRADDDIGKGDISNPNTLYGTQFSDNRYGIFHYVIVCKSIFGTSVARSAMPGDGFFIELGLGYELWSKIFMHELGHNLGLNHVDEVGANPLNIPSSEWGQTLMRQFYSTSWPLNYHNLEWTAVNLEASFLG